ncbi:hypothetical protein NM688_g1175 [Phlebia brevispora]|uniref:Uncharacterized protein n=1 Tax=Phlebia brevispora TaxID=194682 RepID=A0ACC1TCK2_9APHY|nr:hypothetical protein NM688_g1175 [Phlebia brevispora]
MVHASLSLSSVCLHWQLLATTCRSISAIRPLCEESTLRTQSIVTAYSSAILTRLAEWDPTDISAAINIAATELFLSPFLLREPCARVPEERKQDEQAPFSSPLGPSGNDHTQDPHLIFTPELSSFVQEVTNNATIPGLSMAVIYGQNHAAEFGTWGQKTEDGNEMTSDTLFYLASCSKAFLSASIGILMDDYAHGRNGTPLPPNVARFDWYTKVKDILPDDWQLMDDWATEKATMRDILSHQSGLPRHDFSYTPHDTPLSVVRKMRYLRPAFELRERFHYNNMMYILGSFVISKYSGMTYQDFVKTRIWEPLNMSSTTLYESEASRNGKLTQAWNTRGRLIPNWLNDKGIDLMAGAGGIMSSAIDMVKWVRMLLNAGVDPVTQAVVVPRSVFETVTSVQIPVQRVGSWPEFSPMGYGMGWDRVSYQGHEIVMHAGGVPGTSTFVVFLPADNLGFVALANAESKNNYELAIIFRILEDYLGLERKHSTRLLSRFLQEKAVSSKATTSQPQENHNCSSSSKLPLEAYAGIYVNPGYPNITLCAPTSNSLECTQALEHFAHFENITGHESLYAIVPTMWTSHARLTYVKENTFDVFGTYLFPHGYGRNQSSFEFWKKGDPADVRAEFVVEETLDEGPRVVGVGLRGLVHGAQTQSLTRNAMHTVAPQHRLQAVQYTLHAVRHKAYLFCECHEQTPLHATPSIWWDNADQMEELHSIFTPELSTFIEEVVDNENIPGLSLAVVHGEQYTTEFKTWGRKTEDGDEMTSDTIFYLASCSKAFLSASIGILMDDYEHGRNATPLPSGLSRFDWYTKVKDILPDDWKLMDEWASEKATMRDILSHQSGLASHDLSYGRNDTPLDVVRKMRHLRPAFELREKYHYTNQMYILGSYVISKYSGMSYMNFVKRRIWEPLNMSSTTFYESEASRDGKLTQAWTRTGRRIPIWMHDEQAPLNAGPGGIMTNTVDMVKWVRTLLNSGVDPISGTVIIPKSTFDTVTSVQIPVDKRAVRPEFSITGYGMGWKRLSYQGHEIILHAGGIPGFLNWVVFLPSDNLGFVALANAGEKVDQVLMIIYRIIEDYLGLQRKYSPQLVSAIQNKATIELVIPSNNHSRSSSPPLPLEDYAGVYVNPGYPNITLCAPTGDSSACIQALKAFSHFEDVKQSQTLYAIISSLWITHGRLQHVKEHTFEMSGTYLFPHGYGKDQSSFETWERGSPGLIAEFVVEELLENERKVMGFGLKGFVGETTMRQRMGGSVEETAEVYFTKI